MLSGRTWVAVLLLANLAAVPSVAAPAAFTPPKPLRIAVGGDYPTGLDGVLTARGLPHTRIFPWEMGDPAVLKQYEVVLLSCPTATRGSLDKALVEWVEAGGRAYVEVWEGILGAWPLAELVGNAGGAPHEADVLPAVGEHPITRSLDAKPINTFRLDGIFVQPKRPDVTKVLARFCPDGGGTPYPNGAAVLDIALGKGELVYSGASLSFCCFHRGPTTEPFLMSIINHLAQGRTVPRLLSDAPAPAADPPAAPIKPAAPVESAPPAGMQLVESAAGDAYNITAQVQVAGKENSRPSVLLLDGRPKQPALWLVLKPDRLELRAGKGVGSPAVAAAKWQAPAGPAELLVRRRAGSLSVVLGDKELLAARTKLPAGGMIAAEEGCLSLGQPSYQPAEPPFFSDDFMREAGDAGTWVPVSGKWATVGVGNEKQSVNGFFVRGEAAETGLTAAGYRFWEEYAAGVSVRAEGEATVGICALRQANGDTLAFEADSSKKAGAGLRLVQVRGGSTTVLARRAGGIAPEQWYRLALRVREGKAEALLDGEPVLKAPQREVRGGGIALLVRGGAARFDDVLVQPSSQPLASPRDEGTPAPEMPLSLGPEDDLTWASAAAPWAAVPERPSLLWHTGDFGQGVEYSLRLAPVREPALRRLILAPSPDAPEREWLTVTATLLPGAKEVTLAFGRPGKPAVEKRYPLAGGEALSLSTRGRTAAVSLGGRPLLKLEGAGALRRAGLEVLGPPVPVGDVDVRAPEVRDYVFGAAPTDWHAAGGTWEVTARWACDPRWSWFAGWGEGTFAAWNKHPVQGDVALDYFVGIKMRAPGGDETVRCRDLNAALCGDGSDPLSGYAFVLGGDGGMKTQLLRKGKVVAEAPDIRVPPGYGVHHQWFRIRVAKVGRRVEMDFEGRPVFRYDDPNPLPGGSVGVWSKDSGMMIPRVTIYR